MSASISRPIRAGRPRATTIPDIDHLPSEALITRNQLATVSGFAVVTLKLWAKKSRGPRVTPIEGRPRYRPWPRMQTRPYRVASSAATTSGRACYDDVP